MIVHEAYADIWPLLFREPNSKTAVVTTGIIERPESRDHVQVSLTEAATEAMRHLVGTGRRRIAYASDEIQTRLEDSRFMAYQSVLAESGIEAELLNLPGTDRPSIRGYMKAYIEERGCPSALFCHNDDAAIAAYRAILDCGLRVPEDCALVGCDGIPDTQYLSVPITTIVQPYVTMCETACQFLERRLSDPDTEPQWVAFPATLEIRESSLV
jgi:DNA-binding LacI/PurR family transcriptional regulator